MRVAFNAMQDEIVRQRIIRQHIDAANKHHADARAAATKAGREGAPSKFDGFTPSPMRKPEQKPKREQEHVSSTKLRDAPTCKPRPEPKPGMGTSREFIPWCDVKKR